MMPASTLLSPLLWAEATFGSVRLGDPRRDRRALTIAYAMARETGASLPKQLHDAAALEATYRFLHSGHVSYEDLLRPHVEMTRQDCREHKEVLLIQDTTEVDYQHHPKTSGLGPVGNGSHQGFLLQSVLAVVPSTREVLGLAHQEPFLRQAAPAKETKQQRLSRERESQVWERSVQAIGSPPQDTRWIHVGDRYSDIFAFLRLCREMNCDFVIRAAQDRCVDLLVEQAERPVPPRSHHPERPSPPAQHLFEVVGRWPAQASTTVEITASQKHPARTATVSLAWQPLRLLPPRTHESKGWHPLLVWVIHVWEPEPPEGVEPLEWVLLSSLPTQTREQAEQRVEWYRARWMVEDFHQGLKTGCQIEGRQIQDYEGLRTLLGLLAPMAVRLMQLRAASRQDPQQPASQVLPSDVVEVVAHLDHRTASTMTIQQCWHAIARYGGYLGRKRDGPPGWKTLWRGWLHIQTLVEGVHLAPLLSRLNL
ncbi:MAG TPA: IS4 family transposase [Ktedonobacteraceae bacterium]|nr:IS4 family transposase [Ktedonobacteraceae bacterium]